MSSVLISPSHTSSAKRLVFFYNFLNFHFQNEHFGMFIILRLHRESLRQMMNRGRVDHSMKIQVLQMLKPIVQAKNHGDIKELLVFHCENLDRDSTGQRPSVSIDTVDT